MSRTRAGLWVVFAVIASALLLALPGAQGAHSVRLEKKQFVPREEIIGVGDTVVWTHADPGQFHSITADDGSFDSHPGCGFSTDRCMKEGDTYSRTFKKVGRFPYYSKLHGGPRGEGMAGAIVVVEKGAGPSSTTTR